ncbi:MAG: glycosyltransferase family 2 protein [Victivallaceae bacterium]|nr:glycosyltransferase family 2 protein [Victivallaceae bacterium]
MKPDVAAKNAPAHGRCSVALALCNGERFIGELLESLFRQTVPPDEIVITDDDSSDAGYRIISDFIAAHPGVIRYERNLARLGVTKNFEKAISLANGDIIFLADQDDIWLPDKIARLRDKIEAESAPCGAFCDSILTDAQLTPLPFTHWELRKFSEPEAFCGKEQFFRCCVTAPMAGHNIAFSSEWKSALLPFPDLADAHDNWIGLVLSAFGAWRIVPDILTLYRQHDQNRSGMAKWRNDYARACMALRENRDEWNYRLYQTLVDRLQKLPQNCGDDVLLFGAGRRDYSLSRKNLSRFFLKRFFPVMRLWFRGDYTRYGHGWPNVFQDLFLRSVFLPQEPRRE